ncbi:Tetratricopeptide-like helical [Penicillium pulvis]|uniref:Tetratricopeptide-like helical n=1 Tax=Penicillium pulvis TaxID=1562058 RepID=UPI00254841D8|nr:Tetratricopeptide-like helical [Penicillium pulvis]KAJ5803535.1 Tetratricopeptide-like helical [Penicillium pulvis]
MADSDTPMDHPNDYAAYPEIDEEVQYPWQGVENQPFVPEDVFAAAIDPRLFGTALPSQAAERVTQAQNQAQYQEQEYEYSDISEDSQDFTPDPRGVDEGDDDSDYVAYEDQSESNDEEPEDDDSDSDARRRRQRRGGGRFSGRYGARGGKGIKRGPRKPLEPGPEFKMLHSEATEAFIDGDYDRAMDRVMRAIQNNPEMFPAHSLLSEIFLAQGQKDKALAALFNGAHTRPKDSTVWLKVARLILQRAGQDRKRALNDVIYCYSRVIEIEPKNYNIRYQRAAIYRELMYNGRAAGEYERILRDRPHNARALRHLAEIYIDLNEVQKAIDHWVNSMEFYLSLDPQDTRLSWSEVNIYVELFSITGQPVQGLRALKSVSRWLLGRGDDALWDDFEDDDREWDFNDAPRRIKTNGYVPGQWPIDSYGLGLPLELRIKMGLFRLKMGYKHHQEALHHFEWLNPDDTSEGARIFDFGDLFREVADALKDSGLPEEAYRFYLPIQETDEHADIGYFMAMADCCMQLGKMEEAETGYLTVAEHDPRHMESRVALAKLYESLGMSDQALKYINEAVVLGRQEGRSRRRQDARLEQLAAEFREAESGAPIPIAPKSATTFTGLAPLSPDRETPAGEEGQRIEDVQFLYQKLQELEPQVKDGVYEATEDWLDIADALLRDFRSNRIFYPMTRQMEFQGYHRKDKGKGATLLNEAHELAGRLQKSIGDDRPDESLSDTIPDEYYGISFDDWLDLFLQYALLLTSQGEVEEAYDALNSAAVASIWFHSKPKSRLIHVCWFTCALRANDEEALAHEARWFIKEYQFVTDTYRLFSMLSRISGDAHKPQFFNSPNMKFMLRQIKAMDFTLPDDPNKPNLVRPSLWKERASLTTKDRSGERIPAESLDIALLILYGHILYSGGSFYPALNYFFRAYALDDQNPVLLLSIGLCFIHHSLKRQSENRHYLIMQGISFLNEYRRVRMKPGTLLQERQEMEFNFARAYHGLGLGHLAIEGYEKVLKLGQEIQEQGDEAPVPVDGADVVMGEADQSSHQAEVSRKFVEDFTREAAYALQCIHTLGGDEQAAKAVTDTWLVI